MPSNEQPDSSGISTLENGPERILVNYRFANYTERSIDIQGARWSEILLGDESLMIIAGAPALPDVSRSLIIPDDRRMTVRFFIS